MIRKQYGEVIDVDTVYSIAQLMKVRDVTFKERWKFRSHAIFHRPAKSAISLPGLSVGLAYLVLKNIYACKPHRYTKESVLRLYASSKSSLIYVLR